MMEAFSVETMSILMLAFLIFVMMFGHPIAFVFGGVGLIFGYLLRGARQSCTCSPARPWGPWTAEFWSPS